MVKFSNKIPAKQGELRVKRSHISLLVSAAMVIAPLPAMSADTGPLAPGGAAGIQKAQGGDDKVPLEWLIGAGVVIGLGILVLANNNNNNATPVTPPTTTTTAATTTTTTKAATTTTTTKAATTTTTTTAP
jgi:hypothetical protein